MNDIHAQKSLSDEKLEAALGAFARNLEAQMPTNDQEVLELFQAQDLAHVPQPDAAQFKTLLEAEQGRRAKTVGSRARKLVKTFHKQFSSLGLTAAQLRDAVAIKQKITALSQQLERLIPEMSLARPAVYHSAGSKRSWARVRLAQQSRWAKVRAKGAPRRRKRGEKKAVSKAGISKPRDLARKARARRRHH